MHLVFPSAEWQLEGVLTESSGSTRGAVICHPHPLYGGNMNNPVVRAVEDGLQRAGYSTLRFNFRGTGESTGSYAGGVGEGDDLRAAVACMVDKTGVEQVAIAGYSFGAMVTLQAGPSIAAGSHLIVVAPPLSFFKLSDLKLGAVPKLFIVGDGDQYCDAAELVEQLSCVPEPKKSVVLGGADHFLYGHETAIRAAVAEFAADGGV
jgi:alpha/beta superfamily hydrolase